MNASMIATAVVAIAFQPVRERANRFANHLVLTVRSAPGEGTTVGGRVPARALEAATS